MTSDAIRQHLSRLTRAEKIDLVQELWDEIATDPDVEPAPLSPSQEVELERRIRELDEHPERALPWNEVRTRIRNRLRG